MPPVDRLVARFAAEPPQDQLPYGRWERRLAEEFLAACREIDAGEEEIGDPDAIDWFPDRTWCGRTYVPATARTTANYELFGFVSFLVPAEGEEPADFFASADFTAETAERNPEWKLDLCDEEIGTWRGEQGRSATMTLVWGRPMVGGGAVATAELADLSVDQCVLLEERFTLLAPDDYRGDFLEILLWDVRGSELARESLYDDEEDDDQTSGES